MGLLLLGNIALLIIGPTALVEMIGVRQTYLITFIVGVIGGSSAFTGGIFYAMVTAFATSEVNLLLLGFVAGISLFLSDSAFFYVIKVGKQHISDKLQKFFNKIESFVQNAPDIVVYLFSYLYFGFSPLPNDILVIALIAAGYTYRQIAPYMLAGNLTLMYILVYTGSAFF